MTLALAGRRVAILRTRARPPAVDVPPPPDITPPLAASGDNGYWSVRWTWSTFEESVFLYDDTIAPLVALGDNAYWHDWRVFEESDFLYGD